MAKKKETAFEQPYFGFIADIDQQEKEKKETAAKKEQEERREKHIAEHIRSWGYCWGWSGPKVREPLDIHSYVVELAEPLTDKDWHNSKMAPTTIYAYMERCIAIEELPDGRWLCEISMGMVHGRPWHKDGTKVILSITDIWPPTRDLRAARDKQKEAA